MGNLLGFDGPFSTTYTVLLDQNRLVRSRSVTFEIGSYNSMERKVSAPKKVTWAPELEVSLPSKGVQPDDSDDEDPDPLGLSGNQDDSENGDLEDLFQILPWWKSRMRTSRPTKIQLMLQALL